MGRSPVERPSIRLFIRLFLPPGRPSDLAGLRASQLGPSARFEGLPARSEGLTARSEGLPARSEGLPVRSEGLPAGSEG